MSDPTMSDKEIKALVDRFYEYVNSPDGHAAMKKAAEQSREFAAKLRRMRHIPPEKLHAPFTI